MTTETFEKGLFEVANGCWAYIQPDGSWGWSNAGLVVDGDETLLVDTLFDLKLTSKMLGTMRDAVPGAARIDTVVNTHANGDHFFGNQLLTDSRVITTKLTNDMMVREELAQLPQLIDQVAARDAQAGAFMREIFSPFDFSGIKVPSADETFVGALELSVGDKKVQLIDVGPAHTASDVIAIVPGDRVVYTGDILFAGSHPAIWAGPVANWRKACKLIIDADIDVIVPGHGPICDKSALHDFLAYLDWIEAEARQRHEAGMSFDEAAFDIDLSPFEHWREPERMIPNVAALYREFGTPVNIDLAERWSLMARYRAFRDKANREKSACDAGTCGHAHH